MEMQLSARRDSRKALLITLDSNEATLSQLRAMLHGDGSGSGSDSDMEVENSGKDEETKEAVGEVAVDAAKDAEMEEQVYPLSATECFHIELTDKLSLAILQRAGLPR